jgi:hypothetical protein
MRLFNLGLFGFLFLLPTIALAAPSEYTLLAPFLGLSKVSLTTYLEGAVKTTIGLAGILAVLMIVICGVQMIGSPSVSQKSASKACITSALFGLLLAMSSWLILNTINNQLLSSDIGLVATPVLPPAPAAVSPPTGELIPTSKGWYFRFKPSTTDHDIKNSSAYGDREACQSGATAKEAAGGIIAQGCFEVQGTPVGTCVTFKYNLTACEWPTPPSCEVGVQEADKWTADAKSICESVRSSFSGMNNITGVSSSCYDTACP